VVPNERVALLTHGIMLWAACGLVMNVARALLPLDRALFAHGLAAPLLAALVTALYFRRTGHAPPLTTATAFLLVVVALDALVVAPFLERSWAMFASPVGTWIPFALIFMASYRTGLALRARAEKAAPGGPS
jgi:peptidoglycan biosynthesis protein MviN/MurJ (putative lipid II flippase)